MIGLRQRTQYTPKRIIKNSEKPVKAEDISDQQCDPELTRACQKSLVPV